MDWKSKRVRTILETALAEDRVTHDVTTAMTVDPSLRATATLAAAQPCVVSGIGCIQAFLELFAAMSAKPVGRFEVVSHPEIFDGVHVRKGQTVAVIRHSAAALLSTERVILNLMQRMSGIATLTNAFVQAVAGTKVKVRDTRQTIPGLRMLDKYAVVCGGGVNHRVDLADGILIQSNHIRLGGGLPVVLERARAARRAGQVVQVEVRTETELEQALAGGAETIRLDNMPPDAVAKAVKKIRAALPEIPIEASGHITLDQVRKFAEAGVNYVSISALTHSAVVADLTMRIATA